MKSLIINKSTPCNCGCHGRDPWHLATYQRVVKQTSDAEGYVQLPYSESPVRVIRQMYSVASGAVYGPWMVDHSSIVYRR